MHGTIVIRTQFALGQYVQLGFALSFKALPEIPGSLVSELKRRDSRFKSRLGIGLGIDIRAM